MMSQLTRGKATRIMYIELKTGYADNGPAWIGRVTFSKTGRTLYYRGRKLQRAIGGGIAGNYFDVETGEEFWVSGIKADQQDHHWAGSGRVEIDEDIREEYQQLITSGKRKKRQTDAA
jgi:hypothetical protein